MKRDFYDSVHGRQEIISDIDRRPSFAVTRSGPGCYYRAESPVVVGHELVADRWSGPYPSAPNAFDGGIK